MQYDVIIIGAGPAGLSAAIYCARKKLNTLVLSVDVGGQANLTTHIENYPGVGKTSGVELLGIFRDQAEGFGAVIESARVTKIGKAKDGFLVTAASGLYNSKAIILAFGKIPRLLGVPGEMQFLGKGVATCVTCDAPLFKKKIVAVVGGGNSAVQGALELSGIASKVYLIHRSEEFRADAVSLEKLKAAGNVEMFLDTEVREVKGEKFVKSIVLESKGQTRELVLSGVFIEIGYMVDASPVQGLVKLNERNEVVVDSRCHSSLDGVFAAGDCTDSLHKQIIIAAGEGVKAALSAYTFLTGGKIAVDWEH